MQVIWCLKFCNMTKSGGTIPPAPNYTCPPPVIYAHEYQVKKTNELSTYSDFSQFND